MLPPQKPNYWADFENKYPLIAVMILVGATAAFYFSASYVSGHGPFLLVIVCATFLILAFVIPIGTFLTQKKKYRSLAALLITLVFLAKFVFDYSKHITDTIPLSTIFNSLF